MTTSNQDLASKYVQAFSNGDMQSIQGMLSDNFVCHVNGQDMNRDKVFQTVGNIVQKLSAQFTPQEVKTEGDKVTMQLNVNGQPKGPLSLGELGGKIQFPATATVRIANGKVAEQWFNFEKPDILKQLGI